MRTPVGYGILAFFISVTLLLGAPWQRDGSSGHAHGTDGLLANARTALAQSAGFVSTFDGAPTAPQPWTPTTWDVAVHSRAHNTWDALEPMQSAHGSNCGAPPATHTTTNYEDSVYQCNNHIMTSIKAADYGMIYLAPNQLVDFSNGEAVVRFDMSTLRSSGRDFVDLWISPYDEHLALPLRDDLPDVQGEPKNAVHIEMDFGLTGKFQARIIRNFVATKLDGAGIDPWTGYESFLTPSASRRDTFELRISKTSVKFGMPGYNHTWIDKPIADLGWSKGVVQLGHHSYNPQKDCEPTSPCLPNTWHWDNVNISPAQPFTILRADRRYVGPGTTSTITFPSPAPAGSRLQFAGIGNSLEISTNGGASWQPAVRQAEERNAEEHFKSYWTSIPTGTTSLQIRGQNWWGGNWRARDITIWSLADPGSQPGVTPTSTVSAPTPTATLPPTTATAVPPTATSAPATSVPATSVPATATAAPTNSFTAAASAGPASVARGSSTTVSAAVTSGSATTALVYVQVVDPDGDIVEQQTFDNQAFTAGQRRTFPVTWSVPSGTATGAYRVKVGVFSPGWGVMHLWNDQAASITVTAASVPPTATPVPPTATPVPTTGQCSPRPPVTTSIVKEFPGVLRVTVSATGANNTIRRIEFTPVNAIVRTAGLPDQTGQFTTTPQTTSTTFRVFQRTRAAARVNLVVTDACGSWPTFVGGGNGAF